MPEMKRNFAKAKMNKDIDERVLPAGEYRDALNVQVATSDTGDVGALQNIRGNAKVTSVVEGGTYVPTDGDTCVGMVGNPSTDKVYYFISSANQYGSIKKDYILEYNGLTGKLTYVFVDIYNVTVANTGMSEAASIFAVVGNTTIRPGMRLDDVNYGHVTVKSATPTLITLSENIPASPSIRTFVANRVLQFPTSGIITGMNVLDDTIYWTDNASEPKKINITKSLKGTGGTTAVPPFAVGQTVVYDLFKGDNADWHTRFCRSDNETELHVVGNGSNESFANGLVKYVTRDDITVIRKSPTQALKVTMSATDVIRTGDTEVNLSGAIIWSGSHNVGDTITGLTLDSAASFLENDIVLFSALGGPANTGGSYDIMTRVVTTVVSEADAIPATTGFGFLVLSISSELTSSYNDWHVALETGEVILGNKFVRFSYRYKYQDGEYSTFAPWSKIAFMPSEYNYFAQEGYNKGMSNALNHITLSNYTPRDIPTGVVEVDLLYKESNNPTVYTVKTLSPSKLKNYTLKTDMVHAVVPSNQLLRPWDNVPRKALAQEVSANRVIYGNYLQNYTVGSDPVIVPSINVNPIDILENGVSSIKSLREYQIGVVYSDGYGRETPVLTNENASVKVPINNSAFANSLSVKLGESTDIPTWAKYFSFYIKEPTAEYYNLAMDRWYMADDGNVWISFPSSERNKIGDDTFLYLKKSHGNSIPVISGSKYKILAIDNEVPDYVKIKYNYLSEVSNEVVDGDITDNIGTSTGGYPLVDSPFISLPTAQVSEINTAGDYRIRFRDASNWNNGDISQFYNVSRITTVGNNTNFYFQGKLTSDVAWTSTDNSHATRIADLRVRIYEGKPKNLPEFNGRFFVKILKTIEVANLITTVENGSWLVHDQMEVGYLNNNCYATPVPDQALISNTLAVARTAFEFGVVPVTGDHPTEHSSHTGGGSYVWNPDSGMPLAGDPISNLNGANEFVQDFWGGDMRGRFFIDRCSAYSWSGWTDNAPGSFEDTNHYWADSIAAGETGTAEKFIRDDAPLQWPSSNLPFDPTSGWEAMRLYGNNVYHAPPWSYVWTYNGSNVLNNDNLDYHQNRAIPSKGMWNSGPWGYLDLSWTGYSSGGGSQGTAGNYGNFGVGSQAIEGHSRLQGDTEYTLEAAFIEKIRLEGAKFRFSKDPDHTVYTVHNWMPGYVWNGADALEAYDGYPLFPSPIEYIHGNRGIRNYATASNEGQWNEHRNLRQKWTVKFKPNLAMGPHEYSPITGTQFPLGAPGLTPVRALHHDGTDIETIQVLTPSTIDDEGNDSSGSFTREPGIWETEPKESADVDIYYQASDLLPLAVNDNTNQAFAPLETTFDIGGLSHAISHWEKNIMTITPALASSVTSLAVVLVTPNGRKTTVNITGSSTVVTIPENQSFASHELTWANCYSFGNGVESDRIQDDYNASTVDNGVKASTVLAEQIKEERRGSGVIWSGIYNSTSGINNTNQFIAAEAITKDLNPSHGSLQRLLARDNTLVMFCEDKVLRAVTNKDALYSAAGNPQLIASNSVVGDATPYVGDWGISKNPESLAVSSKGAYFVDANRGYVLSLLSNGISEISAVGMDSYFLGLKDISSNSSIVGTFDDNKREYNLTTIKNSSETVSFSEKGRSWVSFKSFIPQIGVSLNNEYYTFKSGHLWKHHVKTEEDNTTVVNRNKFYDNNFNSTVTTIFGEPSGGVKSFNTINYEGSKARVTQFIEEYGAHILTGDYSVNEGLDNNETTYDNKYFNLTGSTGWYMESLKTDLQEAGETEFENKEGKWFGVPAGKQTAILDTSEFITQGLGVATASFSGTPDGPVTISAKSNTGSVWDITAD